MIGVNTASYPRQDWKQDMYTKMQNVTKATDLSKNGLQLTAKKKKM